MRSLIVVIVLTALVPVPLRAQERLLLREPSPGTVLALRHSPDGSRLAVSFRDNRAVRVYPVAGGAPVVIPSGHDSVTFPRFTPDGRGLVCGSFQQNVRVFDAATGALRMTLTEPDETGSFAVSPDGRTLAVAAGDGSLRLFDFATLRERQTLQRGSQTILTFALSGDGHALATAQVPGVVVVRKDGKPWDRFDLSAGARNQVWRLTFSPDGTVLAVTNSGRTTLRDLAAHKSLGEFPAEVFAFAPDGRAVAGLEPEGVRFRDLAGRPLKLVPLRWGAKVIQQLLPAAGARAVVVINIDGAAVLHEVPDPAGPDARSVTLRKPGALAPLALTPDGRIALVADAEGRLHFYDTDAGSETFGKELGAEAPEASVGRLTALVVSPDGRRAAAVRDGGVAHLWDVAARREAAELSMPPLALTYHFSADGDVFTAAGPGGVWRWKAATGQRLNPAHPRPVLAASLLAWPAAGGSPADLAAAAAAGEVRQRLDAGHEGAAPLTWPLAVGGDVLVTMQQRGLLRLIDLPTGKETELQRPVLPIHAVQFSPDGKLLATFRSDGSLEMWDAATGRPTGETTPPFRAVGVRALLFSPDGRRVLAYGMGAAAVFDRTTRKAATLENAVAGGFVQPQFSADGAAVSAEGYYSYGAVGTWDAVTGRPVPPPKLEADKVLPATVLSAAPDGKRAAAQLSDGSVLIWDLARPEASRRADRNGITGSVKELRFSPDGRLLAGAGFDGSIPLWDPATGKRLKVLKHHTGRVADVAFSPDGKLLAVEAADQSGSLWEVDPESASFGKLRAVLADLKARIDPGLRVWSPDGKLLAVLTEDRVPRVIDAASGAVRHTLPAQGANVLQMAFAADGRTLVVRTAAGRLSAWDGMTGKEVTLPHGLPATAASLVGSADGWLAVASETHVILWRGQGGPAPVLLDAPKRAGAPVFSADGKALASGGSSLLLWRLSGGAWKPVAPPRQPGGGPFTPLDLSAGGRVVLVKAAGRGELIYGDMDSGKWARVAPAGQGVLFARLVGDKPRALVRGTAGSVGLGDPLQGQMARLYSPASRVTATLTSADGGTTVTGSADGSLRWYVRGGAGRPRYTVDAHAGQVTRLALSPDGKRLLSMGGIDQVALWDCSGEPKLLRPDLMRNATAAEWSPDGTKVAAGSAVGEVRQWDASGAAGRTIAPATSRLTSLSLSNDGRTLAALDDAGTAHVYDTRGEGVLATVAGAAVLALSPDGKWLAAADAGGTVRLYEARTGKEGGTLTPFPQANTNHRGALEFSPDSRTLSVVCRDGTVRHWDLAAHAERAKFPACYWIIFSGDSRWRVGSTTAGTIAVWDAATGQEKVHWPGISQASVSDDGQFVLLRTGASGLKLFDANGGEPVEVHKQSAEPLYGAALTPDGKTVITATYSNRVRFWDRTRGADRAVVRMRDGLGGNGTLSVGGNGRLLVTTGLTSGLHLWDVAEARECAVLGNSGVSQYQLSRDGSTLAASFTDGSLRVFDTKTAPERARLTGHTGPVTAVAVSADGKRAASAGEDRTVRLYDLANPGHPAAVLRGSRSTVLGVAISPDGRTVAGACADGTVRLWPSETRDELLTLTGHTGWSVRLRYLPDGKRALSTGRDGLRLWDLEKGKLIRAFAQGHQNNQFDLSADGKRCLSADEMVIREWDVETGKGLREFKGLTNSTVWVVLYLPGEKEVLASSGDGRTLVWDRATGEKKREFRPGGYARCGAVSPDGKWLATGDGSSNRRADAVRVWDLATGKVVRAFGLYVGEICWVAWSPDGKRLLVAAGDKTLRVWDPETGKELRRMTQPTWVDCAAWLPDGRRVLSTGNAGDNRVHLWDVETGKELHTFAGHQQPAISVAVAPDGRTALSTGKDGTVRMWNLGPADPVVLSGHEGEVWSVAFSPDGKLLATAGTDRTVRLWDVSGDRDKAGYGRPVRTLTGAALGLLAVAFSPDGKRLAAGEGDLFRPQAGAVRLWDVAGGDLVATLRGHTGAVRTVTFSPDGKRLASGGTDMTIRLWGPADGSSRGVWQGHKTAVTGLAFDHDGGLLASSGAHPTFPNEAGEVLLWDVATGRRRGPLVGHTTGLTGVALAPDGTTLYASGYDETVRVWSLPRPAP